MVTKCTPALNKQARGDRPGLVWEGRAGVPGRGRPTHLGKTEPRPALPEGAAEAGEGPEATRARGLLRHKCAEASGRKRRCGASQGLEPLLGWAEQGWAGPPGPVKVLSYMTQHRVLCVCGSLNRSLCLGRYFSR